MTKNMAKLGIEVDSTQVKEATAALEEFAKAADRARDALERLGRGFAVVEAGTMTARSIKSVGGYV